MKTRIAQLLNALFAALLMNGFVAPGVFAEPPHDQMPHGSKHGAQQGQQMMDMGMMSDMMKEMHPMAMGGCGMGSMPSPFMSAFGPISKLNLTKEQRSQLTPVRKDLRRKQLPLMEKLADNADQLADLEMADNPDFSEIGRLYGQMAETRHTMATQAQEAYQRALSILTEEQRRQLEMPAMAPARSPPNSKGHH